jgi:hypothetical protein
VRLTGSALPRGIELFLIIAIVVLGAWLRLSRLDLTEYKFDEATAIDLTLPLIEGRALPEVGLVSSVGIRNPPMMMYLLAAPLSIAADPLVASAFVAILSTIAILMTYAVMRPRFGVFVALGAAALFATAPWAVLTGRKIWAQDFLPIFCVALLHCLFAIIERPKTRLALAVPVLVCVLWQLHFSAFAVLPVVGLIGLYAARQLRWPAFALGVAIAALMLIPYVHHQIADNWRDFQRLTGIAGRSLEAKRYDLKPVWYTADLSGADGWSYVTGASDRAFTNAAASARRAAGIASIVSSVLLLGGFVVIAGRIAWRVWVHRAARPLLHIDDERRMVLLLWVGGIWVVFIAARLEALYPHYFVLTYPAPFVIVALALDDIRGLVARWWPAPAMWMASTIVVAMCVSYAMFDIQFSRFLDRQGGTRGDYGVAYRHKRDIVEFARAHQLEIGEAPDEITQLAKLRRRYPAAALDGSDALPPGRFLDVRDRLRGQEFPDCQPERRRQFGPLVTCVRQ